MSPGLGIRPLFSGTGGKSSVQTGEEGDVDGVYSAVHGVLSPKAGQPRLANAVRCAVVRVSAVLALTLPDHHAQNLGKERQQARQPRATQQRTTAARPESHLSPPRSPSNTVLAPKSFRDMTACAVPVSVQDPGDSTLVGCASLPMTKVTTIAGLEWSCKVPGLLRLTQKCWVQQQSRAFHCFNTAPAAHPNILVHPSSPPTHLPLTSFT